MLCTHLIILAATIDETYKSLIPYLTFLSFHICLISSVWLSRTCPTTARSLKYIDGDDMHETQNWSSLYLRMSFNHMSLPGKVFMTNPFMISFNISGYQGFRSTFWKPDDVIKIDDTVAVRVLRSLTPSEPTKRTASGSKIHLAISCDDVGCYYIYGVNFISL